jgi:hypothetical protein
MSNFHYETLADSEFRIAILHPGERTDAIEIRLSHASVDQNPTYEALSYVWGDATVTESINLHGQPFNITVNLFFALRRLRHKDKPRHIWIDSICIDQSNNLERQQQISRMRDIYSRAFKVIVWTGEDDKYAISAAHLTSLAFATLRDNPGILELSPAQSVEGRYIIMNHDLFLEHAASAQKFLGNQWFRRVWTFQEAYLARNIEVVCGKTNFSWRPFVLSWSLLDRLGIKLPLKGMESATTLFATCIWAMESELLPEEKYQSRLRLSNLMRATYAHLATDKRDLIFGLLAMVAPRDGITFTSDYDADVEEVYTRYARLMIHDDGHLQILSDARNRDRSLPLPSWVPDWREKHKLNPLAERIRSFHLKYNLNKGFDPPEIIISVSNPQKLHLHGVRLGTIQRHCSLDDLMDAIHPDRIKLHNWQNIICQFKQMFYLPKPPSHQFILLASMLGGEDHSASEVEHESSHGKPILDLPSIYSHTDEPILSAFINTLAGDFLPTSKRVAEDCKHHYPWFHDYKSMTWKEAFRPAELDEEVMGDSPYVAMRGAPVQEVMDLLFDSGRPTRWAFGMYDILENLKVALIYKRVAVEVCKVIHDTACRRCLYVTDNGFLGLGPREVRVGDGVYALLGGDVPFVLRETENPAEFTLLGDSYVHGIMDGELWRFAKDGMGLDSVDGSRNWKDIVLV